VCLTDLSCFPSHHLFHLSNGLTPASQLDVVHIGKVTQHTEDPSFQQTF
jgi:hypothetical protein